MEAFTHVVSPGAVKGWNDRYMKVYVTIQYTSDGRLSITGVEGPRANGNCAGGCGQIQLDPEKFRLNKGWTRAMVDDLRDVWERWHLNDLNAGTPAQMDALRSPEFRALGPYTYDGAVTFLKEQGLYEVPSPDGRGSYRYGTAWLKEDVPEEVLARLFALPTDDGLPTVWWPR